MIQSLRRFVLALAVASVLGPGGWSAASADEVPPPPPNPPGFPVPGAPAAPRFPVGPKALPGGRAGSPNLSADNGRPRSGSEASAISTPSGTGSPPVGGALLTRNAKPTAKRRSDHVATGHRVALWMIGGLSILAMVLLAAAGYFLNLRFRGQAPPQPPVHLEPRQKHVPDH